MQFQKKRTGGGMYGLWPNFLFEIIIFFSRQYFKDQYCHFSKYHSRSLISMFNFNHLFTFGKIGSLEMAKQFSKVFGVFDIFTASTQVLNNNQTLLSPQPLSGADDGEQLKSYPELGAPGPHSSSSSSATRANQTLLIHGIRIISWQYQYWWKHQ